MNLFEGLKSYEVVLMVCGIALFAVSLGSLIFYVAKQRGIGSLGLFFAISIVMIGYPSIKKIQYGEGTIEMIDEATEELAEDPQSESAREELRGSLQNLEGRRITNPTTLLTVAKGQAAVGDTTKAVEYATRALKVNPNDRAALNFMRTIRR